LTCTNCDLHKECTAPVPMSATGAVRFAVIGEAPGSTEDAQGEPFVGVSGLFLREQFKAVGFDPGKVAYLNTVCCWPHMSSTLEPRR
jgi:uracil-DNA glycosylase family 4